jgi:phosphoglucosamine mutase
MLTALVIAKAVSESNKSLHDLASSMTKFPQVIVNMTATNEQKQNLKSSDTAKQILLDFNQKLSTVNGRLLVRPSGTEPLIRITMWGEDTKAINDLANELKTKLGEIL